MRKKLVCTLFAILIGITLPIPVIAHSGGTDSNGGHRDSSTGEYHYHHGYPAHDHYDMNGDGIIDCPYDFADNTASRTGAHSTSISGYNSGYDAGWDDGYEDGYDDGYSSGEDYGYDTGYKYGRSSMEATIESERKKASKEACFLSALIGIPVVFLSTGYFVGKSRDNIEAKLKKQIKQLELDLQQERNNAVLKSVIPESDISINLPEGVSLTAVCVPRKGSVLPYRPYGDFTVYTTKGGKKYHCRYRCCNALTPMHFFNLPGAMEPCKNCVPKDMYPQPLPEWYLKIKYSQSVTK